MYQLISKEQQYATGLQFAITRFVSALAERKGLITPAEHKILFQNSEEVSRNSVVVSRGSNLVKLYRKTSARKNLKRLALSSTFHPIKLLH